MTRIFARAALPLLALLASVTSLAVARSSGGFTPLFDGKTLNGWTLESKAGPGYVVKDGLLVCPADGGGNLLTDKEYSDFILRLDYRTEKGGNNGVGIRAPLAGDAAYQGMEIQVLDDDDPQYAHLEPGQYTGSVYKVLPAKRGANHPAGQWNHMEITAQGRHIKVTLNGKTLVNGSLNAVRDPAVLADHPGILRDTGHLGLLGHNSLVEFKNIAVKDLSRPKRDNTPPDGFTALFNGKDLAGWKGLVADPPTRAKMDAATLAAEQAKANDQMRSHWKPVAGALTYDGKGNSLCTARDYRDFEMLVDWKIQPDGDSGIYLRGSPQVQIWERADIGSGGLFNNEKNPSAPTVKADRPVGEWNRFRILMVGDKVTVFLNGTLATHNVTMENYWERDKPIYPTGQIELQHHNSPLYFKNLYLRDLSTGP